MQGGKAIASGGYGCVFYPALRCKNKDRSHCDSSSKCVCF